jgi:flagellar hook protein FlgE
MGSALSGLDAQQFSLDTIGNNLANATTSGFKASTVDFQTLLSQTFRLGSAPQGTLGGVDPTQLGLGVTVGTTTKNFSQGELNTTGVTSDLAINGTGFFIMNNSQGQQVYTRDGAFSIDPQGLLHDPATGFMVQGVEANFSTFTIPAGGPIGNVSIPVGNLQIANATKNAVLNGNLNSGGNVANNGTTLESAPLVDNTAANAPATAATALVNLSRVNGAGFLDLNIQAGDTITVDATKGGIPLPEQKFFVGPSLPVGYDGFGTTLGQFDSFLKEALGINTDNGTQYSAIRSNSSNPNSQGISFSGPLTSGAGAFAPSTGAPWLLTQAGTDFGALGAQLGDIVRFNSGNGAGQSAVLTAISTTTTANDTLTFTPLSARFPLPVSGDQYTLNEPAGVGVAGAATPWFTAGSIHVAGNAGTANAITNLQIQDTSQNVNLSPFTQIHAADGESVTSNAQVFDSIGGAHQVAMTYVLLAKGVVDPISGAVGNTWQVFTESPDSKLLSGSGVLLGTDRSTGGGQIMFSTDGQFISQQPASPGGFVTMNLPNQGAITPLTFATDFSQMTGFANTQSTAFMKSQDGLATGILTDYQIDQNGVVKGIFTNGATRDLAQIMLARFPNPNGLKDDGANDFSIATNSGTPIISAPGTQSAGTVTSGALEASNVDMAKEFSNMIVAERAFQADSKVITRSDQMLDSLINIV